MVDAFYSEGAELRRTVAAWARFVFQFKLRSVLIATFFALLAAAVLLVGGRRLFGRLIDPDPAIEKPSYLSRLSVAFWSTLAADGRGQRLPDDHLFPLRLFQRAAAATSAR